ncbi:MAG: HlyD family efflux transporter periplasmic adaptor subunit [Saprospiraceae bacterium]|nr:HlyD family efflux transporter periplasmic adaptor subunit [Saprospiraceae bacterium]
MKFSFIFTFIFFISLSALLIRHSTFSISSTLPAIIRPLQERTEITSLTSGLIDTLYVKEGDKVSANSILALLKDPDRVNRESLLQYEMDWRQKLIADLKALNRNALSGSLLTKIQHPALRQQLQKYMYRRTELETTLLKAKKELDMASYLFKEKVIASKEFFDKENEYDRQVASRDAYLREQPGLWEQELALREQELAQYQSQLEQLENSRYLYEIRAPVAGTIQDIGKWYRGSAIQAGQVIGSVSPDVELIAECYAGTRDIGLLYRGQEARFQVDAFDYKYFGILTGRIISIDNDFTILDNKPVYKVKCCLDHTQMHLKNGFTGNLKKGMTLTARFTIAERTLWQLLWDNMDDWLNPSAPIVMR